MESYCNNIYYFIYINISPPARITGKWENLGESNFNNIVAYNFDKNSITSYFCIYIYKKSGILFKNKAF